MTFKKMIVVVSLMLLIQSMHAQQPTINLLDSGRKTAIRGLSVVDDNVIWASGNNGTVARSIDGGKTFEWLTVAGYEKRDFRDIEAFDKNTAIIMGIAEPAIILKTKNGGKSWHKVFEDSTKGMFLDAMDFDENGNGVVIGDPINNKLFMAYTSNAGESWIPLKENENIYSLYPGEAMFASSGTNIKLNESGVLRRSFITGGTKARFIPLGASVECCQPIALPIIQGKETTGANSVATFDGKVYAIVGGDFANDKTKDSNCVLLKVNPNYKFTYPQTPPHGYRSCVEYITEEKLITCGTSGVDISNDGGMNWQLISGQSFHVCQKAKKGNKVFLAGSNGKVAELVIK